MAIPEITDEAGWREWKVAPRKGLLTCEIGRLIGETPAMIRGAIRNEQLPGVALKVNGITFAYAATADEVIAEYELSVEVAEILRKLTQTDAPDEIMYFGVPIIHAIGPRVELTVRTEFEDSGEFQCDNEGITERF